MTWQETIRSLPRPLTIVGIGNPMKGDDGAGPLLAQLLADRTEDTLIDAGVAPENFISPILSSGPKSVLLIDAVASDAPVGHVDIVAESGLSSVSCSTHAVPLPLLMSMLRQRSAAEIVLLGIAAGDTRLGAPLSAEVARAVEDISDCLAAGPAPHFRC